jgi:hypothetical protein
MIVARNGRYLPKTGHDHESPVPECGLAVTAHEYQFRSRWAQRMYLGLSAYGGKYGFNAAAPAAPVIAASDRGGHGDGGAIVLVRARRQERPGAHQGGTANR